MKTIEKLIDELFKILLEHYRNNSVYESKNFRTHIKYPIIYLKTGNKETRISEQEAKQIFIQLLEREGYTYSVETPTLCHKYKFSKDKDKEKEIVPRIDDKAGQSGNIDVSIYNDIKLDSSKKFLCHIEFKAKNPVKHDIQKDILKLYNEDTFSQTNYFVHVIIKADGKTISSLLDKYVACKDYGKESGNKVKVYIANFDNKRSCNFYLNEDFNNKLQQLLTSKNQS